MKTISGIKKGNGFKVALVVARFNEAITKELLKGAIDCLKKNGVDEKDITVVWVPGAFEIPQTVKILLDTKKFKGIVPLGCVIRGETTHYDYVCESAASGVLNLALQSNTALSFGVLTTESYEQAEVRAGGKKGNKGWDATEAMLEILHVMDQVQ